MPKRQRLVMRGQVVVQREAVIAHPAQVVDQAPLDVLMHPVFLDRVGPLAALGRVQAGVVQGQHGLVVHHPGGPQAHQQVGLRRSGVRVEGDHVEPAAIQVAPDQCRDIPGDRPMVGRDRWHQRQVDHVQHPSGPIAARRLRAL